MEKNIEVTNLSAEEGRQRAKALGLNPGIIVKAIIRITEPGKEQRHTSAHEKNRFTPTLKDYQLAFGREIQRMETIKHWAIQYYRSVMLKKNKERSK